MVSISALANTVLKSRALSARFFVIIALLVLPSIASAEEYIAAFYSDIDVAEDGTFTVTERIEYVFDEPRRGIYREIPRTHPEPATHVLKKRVVDITLEEVTLNGETVPYLDESTGDLFRVRIGDPDQTLSGAQEYQIRYSVAGGLSYPQNSPPELYFNVTGNEWLVPILYAEATVHGAPRMFREERACYRGGQGAQDSCLLSVQDERTVLFRTAHPLLPGEGMTIAQALAYDAVSVLRVEAWQLGVVLIPLVLIVGLYTIRRAYRYRVAHRTNAPMIAQYEPYPGVKPMYAGLLMDRQLDPHDVTAGIVYLAQQGYLNIRRTEEKVLFFFETDDYEITLMRPIQDLKGAFEETLLLMLFDTLDAPVGTTVSLNALKASHAEQRENYELMQELRESLREDLKNEGFFVGFEFGRIFRSPLLLGLGIFGIVLSFVSGIALILLITPLVIAFVMVAEGRRTRKGYEALDHLEGFKQFLSVTEKERFVFHNAPARNAEQFMEYLPYAIAFGVEEEWAKVFEGITIPNPSWYDGGTGGHAFSAVNMTQSLGAFSTALASSGTSSASSGGGSSGGGSGGGGGGSW